MILLHLLLSTLSCVSIGDHIEAVDVMSLSAHPSSPASCVSSSLPWAHPPHHPGSECGSPGCPLQSASSLEPSEPLEPLGCASRPSQRSAGPSARAPAQAQHRQQLHGRLNALLGHLRARLRRRSVVNMQAGWLCALSLQGLWSSRASRAAEQHLLTTFESPPAPHHS